MIIKIHLFCNIVHVRNVQDLKIEDYNCYTDVQ
jgi:hypothetical protein